MKIKIILLLLCTAAIGCFGAYQFTSPEVSFNGNNSLTVNSSGNVSFQMTQNGNAQSVSLGLTMTDSLGNSQDFKTAALPGGTYVFRGSSDLLELTPDSTVKFWVDADGQSGIFAGQEYKDGKYYIGFNTTGNGTLQDGNADYIFEIPMSSSGGNAPAGQPLPGAAAALLTGGALYTYRRLRKR